MFSKMLATILSEKKDTLFLTLDSRNTAKNQTPQEMCAAEVAQSDLQSPAKSFVGEKDVRKSSDLLSDLLNSKIFHKTEISICRGDKIARYISTATA